MRVATILPTAVLLRGAGAHVDAPEQEVRIFAPEAEPETTPEAETTEKTEASASLAEPRPTSEPGSAVRIDNTSLASFRESWQKLYSGLSTAEQTRLRRAAAAIAFAPYSGVTNVPQDLRNSPIVPEIIRDQIDGLTYQEIIELSRKSARPE
jgi:hypothetical protein